MTITYRCLGCGQVSKEKDSLVHSDQICGLGDFIVEGYTPSRADRTIRYLLSKDINYFLATAGGIVCNIIFIHHLKYSLTEALIHSLGFGFLLGRLVRYEK